MYDIRTKQRRGLVLLVVLGVLALFSILAVTYLTFASNSRQAAFNAAQKEFHDPNPKLLMDEAIGQVLRGTTNIESSLFRHDLLGDFYGYQSIPMGIRPIFSETIEVSSRGNVMLVSDGIAKVPLIFAQTQPVREPLLPVRADAPENVYNGQTHNGQSHASVLNMDDILTGRTITFLEGPLKNTTHRISRWCGFRSIPAEIPLRYSAYVDFDLARLPNSITLDDGTIVKASDLLSLTGSPTKVSSLFFAPVTGNPYRLVINPIPRNTNGITGSANSMVTSLPLEFQPNYGYSIGGFPVTFYGNEDETHDAPDHFNLFLSYQDRVSNMVIPSFHRPNLITKVKSLVANNNLDLFQGIRGATLRPIATTNNGNKLFTGGNPNLFLRIPHDGTVAARNLALATALTNGPWDVDNDGDGIADSIWIDPKLPIVSAEDGTRVRPLIAVQIEDLSARFNVNAHGNLAHTLPAYTTLTSRPVAGNPSIAPIALPIGRGIGPSEIFPVLGTTPATRINAVQSLLSARYRDKRRTEVGLPSPGISGDEFVDQFLYPNQPRLHQRMPVGVSHYGLPLDRFGRGSLAIDAFGNLYSDFAGTQINPNIDEVWNDPYEFSAGMDSAADTPYTLEDFESLIDRNRWSQSLQSSRLLASHKAAFDSDPTLSEIVTPLSKSSTTPPSLLPPELATDFNSRLERNAGRPSSLIEALLARVIRDSRAGDNNFAKSPSGQTVIDEQDIAFVNLLLAPELRTGQSINLNRPFGNGIDDNGNLVVDEPLEKEVSYGGIDIIPQYNLSPVPANLRPLTEPNESAREALARHIYCLAMLLMNDNPQQKERWRQDTMNIPPGPQLDRYIARRIAQWAVNVVDYRDSDSIMTRFIFDYNPLNGWNTNPANNDPNNPPEYGEVWGCESPDLVFMESLAFHDVRVRDTKLEQDGKLKEDADEDEPDENTDQIRKPEGSLFLELYNPRSRTLVAGGATTDSNSEGLPSELYANTPAGPALNLSAMAPVNPGTMASTPVWRIAISEPHHAPEQLEKSPLIAETEFPDTYSFEPHVLDELALDPNRIDNNSLRLERFVLFVNASDPVDLEPIAQAYNMEANGTYSVATPNIFCNINPNIATPVLLPTSTYLTVAPRTITHLGSLTWTNVPNALSPQRFVAGSNAHLRHWDANNSRTTPATLNESNNANVDTQGSLGFIAQTFPPLNWGNLTARDIQEIFGNGNFGVGVNISEPLADGSYYRRPTDFLNGENGSYPLLDAYWDFTLNTSSDGSKPSDDPFDIAPNRPIAEISTPTEPFLGTQANYRTAFLQRLANPLLPFQPDAGQPNYNPYRTIDWIPLDLSVYSGEELPTAITDANTPTYQASRQRSGNTRNELFSNETELQPVTPLPPGPPGTPIPYIVQNYGVAAQSLGYLNQLFGPRLSRGALSDTLLERTGQPLNAFALHPWLNRPYTSPLELMMVPAVSQGRLFEEFRTDSLGTYGYNAPDFQTFRQPFNHLINFLDSDTAIGGNAGEGSSHLYRLFEYLTAKASFRGEAKLHQPVWSTGPRGLVGDALAARYFWSSTFQFPFNQSVSDTALGRLNLNTLSDPRVLGGLNWNHLTDAEKGTIGPGDPHWTVFNTTVRGNWQQLPNLSRPFTSTLAEKRSDGPTAPPLIDGSILRKLNTATDTPGMRIGDAFRSGTEQYNDPNRSALMRYQSLMRLPNLTTNNSQTYLVRITMGFFEYNESEGLGKEHLVDYGRNKRYRATYVIDRSVPVSYETGEDRDTRNCILLERFYRD